MVEVFVAAGEESPEAQLIFKPLERCSYHDVVIMRNRVAQVWTLSHSPTSWRHLGYFIRRSFVSRPPRLSLSSRQVATG